MLEHKNLLLGGCSWVAHVLAAAFDFSIMAMQPINPLNLMEGTLPFAFRGLFPMVDVVLLYTTFVPRTTTDLVDPICITVGEKKLFTLAAASHLTL